MICALPDRGASVASRMICRASKLTTPYILECCNIEKNHLQKNHMPSLPEQNTSTTPENMPFVAPCRTLDMNAPLRWLRLGWMDLTRAPKLSLAYGLVLTLLSLLISVFTWRYGTMALYLGLASGFVFMGPILAVGLYSISHQLDEERKPMLGYCIRDGQVNFKELLVLGVILLVVLLLWARAATVVSIFLPMQANPDWQQLLPFLGIGSMVGAVFAGVVKGRGFARAVLQEASGEAVSVPVNGSFHGWRLIALNNENATFVRDGIRYVAPIGRGVIAADTDFQSLRDIEE